MSQIVGCPCCHSLVNIANERVGLFDKDPNKHRTYSFRVPFDEHDGIAVLFEHQDHRAIKMFVPASVEILRPTPIYISYGEDSSAIKIEIEHEMQNRSPQSRRYIVQAMKELFPDQEENFGRINNPDFTAVVANVLAKKLYPDADANVMINEQLSEIKFNIVELAQKAFDEIFEEPVALRTTAIALKWFQPGPIKELMAQQADLFLAGDVDEVSAFLRNLPAPGNKPTGKVKLIPAPQAIAEPNVPPTVEKSKDNLINGIRDYIISGEMLKGLVLMRELVKAHMLEFDEVQVLLVDARVHAPVEVLERFEDASIQRLSMVRGSDGTFVIPMEESLEYAMALYNTLILDPGDFDDPILIKEECYRILPLIARTMGEIRGLVECSDREITNSLPVLSRSEKDRLSSHITGYLHDLQKSSQHIVGDDRYADLTTEMSHAFDNAITQVHQSMKPGPGESLGGLGF